MAKGRNRTKRSLFLLLLFFFFKMDEIIACLYIDDSDLVEGKQ